MAEVTRIELAVAGLEAAGLPLTDTSMAHAGGFEPPTICLTGKRTTIVLHENGAVSVNRTRKYHNTNVVQYHYAITAWWRGLGFEPRLQSV